MYSTAAGPCAAAGLPSCWTAELLSWLLGVAAIGLTVELYAGWQLCVLGTNVEDFLEEVL
jgi:hypothetical protein